MILAQYIAVFIILAFAVIWVIRAVVGRSRRKTARIAIRLLTAPVLTAP